MKPSTKFSFIGLLIINFILCSCTGIGNLEDFLFSGGGTTSSGGGSSTGGGNTIKIQQYEDFKIQTLNPDSSGTVNFKYTGGNQAIEIPSTVKKLVIKSDYFFTISTYFAKMNSSSNQNITNSETRYITSKSSNSYLLNNQLEFNTPKIQNQSNQLNRIIWHEDQDELNRRLAELPKNPPIAPKNFSRSAGRSALSVGSTKNIVFGVANGYEKRSATLRALGTNCLVWVIDSEYDDGTKTEINPYKYITTSKAKDMANKFDEIYEIIQYVYGVESDKIYKNNQIYDMADICDSGTKVNIVLGDLDEDASDSTNSYKTGYFYSADYMSSPYSNYGKYIYIDSYVFNKWGNSAYETAAHEFQHMINFSNNYWNFWTNKEYDKAEYSETWFNEMMSVLAEDILQSYFNTDDNESSKSRIKRQFTDSYANYGTTYWAGDLESYANVYAYGAFLARNFGGARLINLISTSQKHNEEAITEGLQKIGYNETFESVWKKLPIAFIYKNEDLSLMKNAPTDFIFSKNGKSYSYPMTSFPEDYLNARIYDSNKYNFTAIKEYKTRGFSMHRLESTTNSKISVSLSKPYEINFASIGGGAVNENEKLVFYMREM